MISTEFDGGQPLLVHLVRGGSAPPGEFANTTTFPSCTSPGSVSNAGMLGGHPAWSFVYSSTLAVVEGGGALTATAQATLSGILAASPPLDFNNDGNAEFLLVSSSASPIIWQPGVSTPSNYEQLLVGNGNRVQAADQTGDGRPDLTFSTSSDSGTWYGSSTSFNVSPMYLSKPAGSTTVIGIAY